MVQKLLRVGSSAAVTIPKKSLQELGLKIGDQVSVMVDKNKRNVVIEPQDEVSSSDQKIAKLTMDFINRYRKDLEVLSKK